MPNINSPRYQRWFVQEQPDLLHFKNTSGTWDNTGAQLIRVDQGSFQITRQAPYNRLPVLTGTRSELVGVRGRKLAGWSIRGLPVIPSGAAGTVPDINSVLKNVFGQAPATVASTSCTYSFLDTGYIPISFIGFAHGINTLTQRAVWGCFVSRITFNFNGLFLTADVDGFGGYPIDNVGFSVFDTQAKAGLTAYPTEPSSPTTNGSPIAGFGSGYTCTIDAQDVSLRMRALSLSIETGFVPIADVYGSPYLAAVVGSTRRVSLTLGNAIDEDSSAMNDLKTKCDTDNVAINAAIVAGATAGSIVTFNINNIQPNAFNLRDTGPEITFEMETSFAHASSVNAVDDCNIAFT